MYLASTSMFSFIRICGAPTGNRTQIRRLEISYSIHWTIGATYQIVIHWASQVGTASGIRTHKILILSETRMPIPSWRHESLTNYQRTKLTYSFNINILYHNIDILYTKIGPPDGIRTHTSRILSSMPLPIGLQEVKWSANWESNPDLLNHNQVY